MLAIAFLKILLGLFVLLYGQERWRFDKGTERGNGMQQRATWWNRTRGCCGEDTAFVCGAPALPAELPGQYSSYFFISRSVSYWSLTEPCSSFAWICSWDDADVVKVTCGGVKPSSPLWQLQWWVALLLKGTCYLSMSSQIKIICYVTYWEK